MTTTDVRPVSCRIDRVSRTLSIFTTLSVILPHAAGCFMETPLSSDALSNVSFASEGYNDDVGDARLYFPPPAGETPFPLSSGDASSSLLAPRGGGGRLLESPRVCSRHGIWNLGRFGGGEQTLLGGESL